jgi:5-methylcytosine-specific restriction protein A
LDKQNLQSITQLIFSEIGVRVSHSDNYSQPRKGFLFWFENYNRGSGPVFSIRPAGLLRHRVGLEFGAYAGPCIEHIQKRATDEDYALAYALMNQLEKQEGVELTITCKADEIDWKIGPGFAMSAVRKTDGQSEVKEIMCSVGAVMVPIMAAIAELIGYEEESVKLPQTGIEGGLQLSTLTRRERNPRNRLLCLMQHENRCGVCKINPKIEYGNEVGAILEVHHIEPLSELDIPKVYDPLVDLVPLCPNCHRAIHRRNPAYSPRELKDILGI